MDIFSDVEKALDLRFRKWTEKIFGVNRSEDLVLLRRAMLDEIGSKVETIRRGQRMFSYNHLLVRLKSSDPSRREVLESAFGGGLLETDVREHLTAAGCRLPDGLSVEVETIEAGEKQFEIIYEIRNLSSRELHRPAARLEVIGGNTNRESYLLDKPSMNIGRLAEVTDHRERMLRRNEIVLSEDMDQRNATISRAHAHIRFDTQNGEYRIYDDSSEHGTRIIRGRRYIDVSPGSRGERLVAGDEILLGKVGFRFVCSTL